MPRPKKRHRREQPMLEFDRLPRRRLWNRSRHRSPSCPPYSRYEAPIHTRQSPRTRTARQTPWTRPQSPLSLRSHNFSPLGARIFWAAAIRRHCAQIGILRSARARRARASSAAQVASAKGQYRSRPRSRQQRSGSQRLWSRWPRESLLEHGQQGLRNATTR